MPYTVAAPIVRVVVGESADTELSTYDRGELPMNRSSGFLQGVVAAGVLLVVPAATFAQNYVQTNLVSDTAQPANADGSTVTVDPNLRNAWGLARGAWSPWGGNNAG